MSRPIRALALACLAVTSAHGVRAADAARAAGLHHPAARPGRPEAASGRRGPGAGPVPRPPDHRPAGGRQDHPRRLPQGARQGGHRPEAEHRRRPHVVRPPARARELGHLAGDADDPPGRRSPGQAAADPVLGPVPHPHGVLRGRRPHLDAPGEDRRLRRHRRHGQRRAAEERRLHGPVPRRRAVPPGRGQEDEVPGLQDDLAGRRPDLGPAGGHRRAPGRRPLRAGPGPLPRRQADRRAAAGEPPQAQLVRDLLRRRGEDLDEPRGSCRAR